MMTPSRLRASVAFAVSLLASALQAQWTAPTPEELSMTSIPEAPGAPAVYLFKEELADDGLHMQSFYYRIKILTEGGKEYANVELPFVSGASGAQLDSVSGRTIHADGTIIPFTGKPYEKTIETMQDYKYKALIFSLPSVEPGSIIEYRYKLHTDDYYFSHPDWIVQTSLYTRKAHYMWRPTERELVSTDGKQTSSSVAWTPILPPEYKVVQTTLPMQTRTDGGHTQLELTVHDIPPVPHEEYMPPLRSLSYKVMFYYTSFRSAKEYWMSEGKTWSRGVDHFIGSGGAVAESARALTAGIDSPEQKLRTLYATVMALENTDYTREHSGREERAAGLKEIKSTDDVLARKRGNSEQLTELFIAMARSIGMKAYLMGVADRNQRLFVAPYLNMGQIDDYIAIVNVGGKEMFFDPGERYCTFGQLAWNHALTGGLRQVDGGVDLSNTPGGGYKDTHVNRVADLKLDEQGVATGTVRMEYTGNAALPLRQQALRGDETSLHHNLRSRLEHLLPGGMDVKVVSVENLTNPDLPLKVLYEVKGPIGSPTGKRLLVQANLFEVNSKPLFPDAKRELPIDMRYPSVVQDAVRLTLPSTMVVESAPTPAQGAIPTTAAFDTNVKSTANSISLYRNVTMGKTMFDASSYGDIRGFYGKLEGKDQESVVLTRNPSGATPAGGEN